MGSLLTKDASIQPQQTHASRAGPNTLEQCTNHNTSKFGFKNLTTFAKVVRAYDGDTITVAFDTCGLGFYQHNVRLLGIDCPEIRGKTPEEKAAAIAARDYMRYLILDKIVLVYITGTDKYGRLLARVLLNGEDVSDKMLAAGHAKPYLGGKREEWIYD